MTQNFRVSRLRARRRTYITRPAVHAYPGCPSTRQAGQQHHPTDDPVTCRVCILREQSMPAAPLLQLDTIDRLARTLRVSRRSLHRWKRQGYVPLETVDRLPLHPTEIWPDYYERTA